MIILYPILLSLLAFRYYKSKQRTPLSLFVVLYYLFSSLTATYLYYSDSSNKFDIINITFHSVLYHFFCLFLLIEGFHQIEKKTEIELPHIMFGKLFYILMPLIIMSFVSIYDSINLIREVSGMSVIEMRTAYFQQELYYSRSGMLISYINNISHILYPIYIFFFFYISHYYPKQILFAVLLIISSLSIVVANLTIAGRDAIVQWMIMFSCLFILFRPLMTKNLKRSILLLGSIIAILASIIFVFITMQRFGEKSKDIIDSFLSYYGQGFINFSKYFELFHDGSLFGRSTFPAIFPVEERVSIVGLNYTFPSINFELNVFTTLIGSFYMDFGYFGTIALCISIFLLFMLIKKLYRNDFAYYFLLVFVLQILICGVFYFMQYSLMFQKIFAVLLVFSIYKKLMRSLN